MRQILEEFLIACELSWRLRFAAGAAVALPAVICALGWHAANGLTFAEPLAPLAAPVRESLFHDSLEVALVAFLGLTGAAGKEFRRLRKRMYGLRS